MDRTKAFVTLQIIENAVSNSQTVKVAVVEDDEQLRDALAFQISTTGIQVVTFTSAEEFLEAGSPDAFDCIVVDLFLPKINGLELQERLHRTDASASVIFISGHGDLSLGMHAMRKGAVDFLEKPVDDEALLTAIMRAVALSRKRRIEDARRIELEGRLQTLTRREREVFLLVTAGLLNKQVGAEMGTTERTVKAQRQQVMSKMQADSLADLVRMAGTLKIYPTLDRAGYSNKSSIQPAPLFRP
jgi:two-component system, LuxR family, response regulator FixJ